MGISKLFAAQMDGFELTSVRVSPGSAPPAIIASSAKTLGSYHFTLLCDAFLVLLCVGLTSFLTDHINAAVPRRI
jgi:hypothetical protein